MIKKFIIGLISGIICGFFGTGGGLILVPAFMYILKIDSREARATSICCMLSMVVASSIFYYKENYVDFKIGILCAIGGIIGGFIGSKYLLKVNEYVLKIIFIVFLGYFSIKYIII